MRACVCVCEKCLCYIWKNSCSNTHACRHVQGRTKGYSMRGVCTVGIAWALHGKCTDLLTMNLHLAQLLSRLEKTQVHRAPCVRSCKVYIYDSGQPYTKYMKSTKRTQYVPALGTNVGAG